ncbi:ATP-binding protein [Actinokineospora enzanensis]|uniref:ATP-binding protein n=1 Tax=Actinokineospora enzanensis TaxID=155975 RepID=UPI00035D3F9E|nr:DUF87 domain-containing protein [Actinokineospora enzanensis]
MIEDLAALATLRLDWADTPDHIWRDSPYHVDGLHLEALGAVDVGIRDATASDGPSPIGLVLQGQKGVGKTHLLGLVRRQVYRAGGYFFLDDITAGDSFWENTAEALRTGLSQMDESGEQQVTMFVRRVCERGTIDPGVAKRIVTGHGVARSDLDAFDAGLRALDRQLGRECADTARALVLYASEERDTGSVGDDYLVGAIEQADRRKWGIGRPKSADKLVREITRLLALTGPIVIAVDQIDTLLARSQRTTQEIGRDGDDGVLVARIADGLMRLREVTRRTVTLLACLPGTWEQIRTQATDTVGDRFRESLILGRVTDADVGRALVAKRLGVAYAAMGFVPPHPTWPVSPAAFDGAWHQSTPRELLKRIGAHIDVCLRAGAVRELTTFDAPEPRHTPVPIPVADPKPDRFAELDELFAQEYAAVDVRALLDPDNEDELMPRLLAAALRGWIFEVGDDDMEWTIHARAEGGGLHASLTRTIDEASDLEEHWAFRAIAATHHLAALNRFRKARAAAGLRPGADNCTLVVLRNTDWSRGTKTQAELKAFEEMGGQQRKLAESDLRTFWALHRLFALGPADLQDWLVRRTPATRSELLSKVLPAPETESGTHPPPEDDRIPLGIEIASGEPVRVGLPTLRKHVALFAGSGSGKTVLLRRIVEECALRGVSSIVLDPNNDLARLGDAWPERPDAWGAGDADLAERYLADTDVVVWTPGRAAGRPLAFQPLPDFAGVLDDEDEFAAAVEVAVAALAPQARLTGATAKASIGLAVLREAVGHHARTGSRSLPALIALLEDLPEGVSRLSNDKRIAAGLAESLKAAMVNDPLFAGEGTPVDPGELLTPRAGKRARVSVVSFIGLPAESQRQHFVNQLQMELFSWIKRNPAGERPLGGLFVMDEAQTLAASGTLTASTRSTIVLAAQARKYGLGLLFATQAPKGLHNQIVGNATTQFFGRLNSPAQIEAANELARAKGSPVADISRLTLAQFYVSSETFGFRQVTTPLCLSHHPSSPLSPDEVLDRARRDPGDG